MNAARPPVAAQLTLYLAGDSGASRRARTHLALALRTLGLELTVRLVDVLTAPEEALAERIYVTPALVLELGGLREMLVGDLSQQAAVLETLQMLLSGHAGETGGP